jgi:16S rRNA processing protein RimM
LSSPAGGQDPGPGEAPVALPVGRVGRAHGLDGSFYLTRPRPRLLALGAILTVGERALEVVRLAGTEQRPIIRLAGVSSREEAEALRGVELTVDSREAPSLGEGEWWAHELEGCQVRDGERLLGTVSRLIELPSCEALEVSPAAGGPNVIVPMVSDAVRRVAVSERRIEVDLDFIGVEVHDSADERDPGAGE